jgi:2-dehydropantoate 2-reductase
MKVVVIGAGAMGSLYGSFFHDAGNEVVFVDVNPAIVEAINAEGAVITRRDGRVDTYRIPATSDPASLGSVMDLALFQVKGFATAAAAELARPVVGPGTIVLTLQNGLGNEDVLRAAYPDNPLLIGISVHSVAMTAPGRYLHSGTRMTALGPSREGSYPLAEHVAEALEGSGFDVRVEHEADIRREVYAKWVINCGSLPTLAVTGLSTDAVNDHEPVLRLIDALTAEACDLAALEGVQLDAAERAAYNRGLFQTAGGKASMLQDVESGRRTEIDSISGAAVRLADRHGHPAPLNRALLALVKGREAAMGVTS